MPHLFNPLVYPLLTVCENWMCAKLRFLEVREIAIFGDARKLDARKLNVHKN